MSLRSCKSCGSRIEEDAQFCIYCGHYLEENALKNTQQDKAFEKKEQAVEMAAHITARIFRAFDDTFGKGNSQKSGVKLNNEEMLSVHTITFHKDSEYASWLKRAGPNVEILSTAASKRGELDGFVLDPWRHGVFRHSSLVVTWRYKQPQLIPVEEPSELSLRQHQKNDVAEQIEKLGRLRDQGLLTDEEFQSKKEDLLARL